MKVHVNLSIEYSTYIKAKNDIKNFSKFFERVLESYVKNHTKTEVVYDSQNGFKKEISDEEVLRMLEDD